MTIRHVLLATGALVLAACGDDASESTSSAPTATATSAPATSAPATSAPATSDPGGDTSGAMVDGSWDVVGLEVDGSTIELLADWPVTMSIAGGQIGGTAACNSYGGALAVDGEGTFVVGELAQTEMACLDNGVMEIESAFLTALAQVDSYELADQLTLTGEPSVVIELASQPEVVDAELIGTTWVLDTVVESEYASNSTAMEDVVLEFAGDGTLDGFTGCRRLEGEWQLDGDRLQVLSLAALDEEPANTCPPEVVEIDQVVIAVVESQTDVAIDGDRLTLTAPAGESLSFRAE